MNLNYFFTNPYIINNFGILFRAFLLSFVLAFLITPFVGKFAKKIGALDLPAKLRGVADRTSVTRLHTVPTPRLGGLASVIAFLISFLILVKFWPEIGNIFNMGIFFGLVFIVVFGFLDDKFEINSKLMFLGHFLTASAVILGGNSIDQISIFNFTLNLDVFSFIINLPDIGSIENLSFQISPIADFFTLMWIIGMLNVVNWVSAIDGLNISLSAIFATTIILIIMATDSPNIALAILISLYIGSILGFLPFNYNPAKIFPGLGEYFNGYMLSVFAILSGTKWSVTLIIFALPIFDGMVVLYRRYRNNKSARTNILKLLSISDRGHLHHKLLDAGFSRKLALLIYLSFGLAFSLLALIISANIRNDFLWFIVGIFIFYLIFTLSAYLKIKNKKAETIRLAVQPAVPEKKVEIKVVLKPEEKDYEKFIY